MTDRTLVRPGVLARARVAQNPASVLTVVWALVAAAAVVTAPRAPVEPHRPVPGWVLVVLFAATQSFVINVQLRREARSVFISEVPTFLALMSLHPSAYLLVRVIGAAVGFGVLRRQYRQPQKLLFNLTLAAAEAGVASVAFGCLSQLVHSVPWLWLWAVVATALASGFTAVGVGLIIELLEGAVRWRVLVGLSCNASVQAVPVATLGTAVWAAWDDNVWAAAPLAVVAVLLLAAYRGYAALQERHLALERLYRFSQVVSHAPGVDIALRHVLEQARDIMHAEQARLTFLHDSASGPGVEVVLSSTNGLRRGTPFYLREDDRALQQVVSRQAPVAVFRTTRDPAERGWLDRCGLRDSIMVPLNGESGPVAVLAVDDRLGDARGFERADVRVLETVANQAAIALRNGELLDRLRHDSLHDPLTGLPNRTLFQREVDAVLARQDSCLVGILDVDAFKDVNDTLGHADGDALLREIGRRMTTALDGNGVVARLGGDEFAVLINGVDSTASAERRGAAMLRAFDAPVPLSGIDVDVSASLGLAVAPLHGDTVATLLKRADVAMYDAKHGGRQLRVFDPSLDTSSPAKLAMVADLRGAIERGDIEVHVQPKVAADGGEIVGVEALARWATAERGDISPVEFVPLAERSGLIRPLTRHVLDVAVAACAGWQDVAPGVGVSVNVSVRSLADDELVRVVERVLRRHRLDASLLTLEITESHIMANPKDALDVLHDLRARGVCLSVDDFGTGYSSLSYLRRLPVNEVKIDRSFVRSMVDEPDDAAIVRSIVELSRTLSLKVVAEGVEDVRTWDVLADLGVDEIQGWVIARAMPHAAFAEWAQRHIPQRQLRVV